MGNAGLGGKQGLRVLGLLIPLPKGSWTSQRPFQPQGAQSPLITNLRHPSRLQGVPRLRDCPSALSLLQGARILLWLSPGCPHLISLPPSAIG